MARWSDLATWRGPTPNQGGAMVEYRGVVLHIAQGWFEGTIAWQKNPDSRTSSHFISGKAGGRAQMVDTDVTAWTQRAGNGHWLSVEFEGFTPDHRLYQSGWEKLSPQQIEFAAQILARAHKVYGVPLRIANNPSERGLGHHSMDREGIDPEWGHDACPGPAIIEQKPAVLARAVQIIGGNTMTLSPRELAIIENADANAWAVRTGVDAPVHPANNPDVPMVGAGNALWDTLRGIETGVGQLVGRPAVQPAPVDIPELVEALRPVIRAEIRAAFADGGKT